MRIAICEDDEEIMNDLHHMVESYPFAYLQLSLFIAANDLYQAYLDGARFDLVFMDIQMNGNAEGFQVASQLRNKFKEERPLLVFITVTEAYVYKGYEVAWRYFLKPITEEIVHDVIEQAIEELGEKQIQLKINDATVMIKIDNIIYVEASYGQVMIHTLDTDYIMNRAPLQDLVSLLHDKGFFQTHRSYLVNLSHVRKFCGKDSITVMSRDGVELRLPLSRYRRVQFIEALGKFLR